MRKWVVCVLFAASVVPGAIRPKFDGKASIAIPAWYNQGEAAGSPIQNLPTYLRNALYEPLFRIDGGKNTLPHLCDSFTYVKGGMAISVRIRDGLRFSDGTPVTPLDLVSAWTSLLREDDAPALRGVFGNVTGFDEAVSSRATSVPGFRIVDGTTFQVAFQKPDSLFHERLAISQMPVFKSASGGNPRGTGPFRIRSQASGKTLLERNPHYREAPPYLQSVTLTRSHTTSQLLDFQLGKYEALAISTNDDHVRAKRYVRIPHHREPWASRIFFLVLRESLPQNQRAALLSRIDPTEIFPALVPLHGRRPDRTGQSIPQTPWPEDAKERLPKKIRILYESGCEYRKACSEAVYSQLLKAGIPAGLTEKDRKGFWNALEGKEYEIVMGIHERDGNPGEPLKHILKYAGRQTEGTGISALEKMKDEWIRTHRYIPLFVAGEEILASRVLRHLRHSTLENAWRER